MFYGIMWFDARNPPGLPAGPGGAGPGRGLAPGGALTWARGAGADRWVRGTGLAGGTTGGEARVSGARCKWQEALSHPVHGPRAVPDKGGAFLKRRRPLQAAAGTASRNRPWARARGRGGTG